MNPESLSPIANHLWQSTGSWFVEACRSNLIKRMERITINRILGKLNTGRKLLLAAVGTLTVAVVISPAMRAQSVAATQSQFQVASVRRNTAGNAATFFRTSPGRFEAGNQTLRRLVRQAYNIMESQISGGPGWIDSDRYDIEAKFEGTSPSAGIMVMLQALLTERFKLVLHHEMKELPIYELTVARGGPKLRSSPNGCIPVDPSKPTPPGQKASDSCGYLGMGRGMLEATSITMPNLAIALSRLTGQPVSDKTGITGNYSVHLTFAADDSISLPPPPTGDFGNPAQNVDAGPSMFTAIQEQLGLKLQAGKGPVEVLVIDHVERPSEN